MVRNMTEGESSAETEYSQACVCMVGHAETFKLGPLGNWGPSDGFE